MRYSHRFRSLRDIAIEQIDSLSPHLTARLRAAGIATARDLLRASEQSLLLAGCTEVNMRAIRRALQRLTPEPQGSTS